MKLSAKMPPVNVPGVRPILAACTLAGVLLLSACGQTGPLYIPNPDLPNQGKPK